MTKRKKIMRRAMQAKLNEYVRTKNYKGVQHVLLRATQHGIKLGR